MNIKLTTTLCFSLIAFVWTADDSQNRIIGGNNANIANYNYQASLRIQGTHTCGAVLISSTRALTAAHCGGGAVSAYSILAGTSDRTVQTCATCALRSPIIAIVRHPSFSNNPSAGYPNDIAVIWFHSIASGTNIGYATLATADDGTFEGAECTVTGWGRTSSSTIELPTTLQSGRMTVISNSVCIDTWNANRIRPEQICAVQADVAMCGGDQGGPIVCDGKVAGIHSFGEANCGPQFPSVFSRVSSYRDWILENSA